MDANDLGGGNEGQLPRLQPPRRVRRGPALMWVVGPRVWVLICGLLAPLWVSARAPAAEPAEPVRFTISVDTADIPRELFDRNAIAELHRALVLRLIEEGLAVVDVGAEADLSLRLAMDKRELTLELTARGVEEQRSIPVAEVRESSFIVQHWALHMIRAARLHLTAQTRENVEPFETALPPPTRVTEPLAAKTPSASRAASPAEAGPALPVSRTPQPEVGPTPAASQAPLLDVGPTQAAPSTEAGPTLGRPLAESGRPSGWHLVLFAGGHGQGDARWPAAGAAARSAWIHQSGLRLELGADLARHLKAGPDLALWEWSVLAEVGFQRRWAPDLDIAATVGGGLGRQESRYGSRSVSRSDPVGRVRVESEWWFHPVVGLAASVGLQLCPVERRHEADGRTLVRISRARFVIQVGVVFMVPPA